MVSLVIRANSAAGIFPAGLAAPSVSGAIEDDAEIVISALDGETFGSLGPDLRIYDDYRNAVHGQVVSTAAQVGTWSSADSRGWDDPLLPGGKGIRCIRSDAEGGVNGNIKMVYNSSAWTEMFIYTYLYTPVGYQFPASSVEGQWPSSSDFKFPWFHDVVGGNEGGNIDEGADVMALSMIGNGTWRHWLSNDFGSAGSDIVWTWGEPTLLMAWAKGNGLSSSGTDGLVETSNSGARQYNRYQNSHTWFAASNSNFYWIRMNMPGFIRQGARFNSGHNFVTAQTYLAIGPGCNARVLITDSATWTGSRVQTICTVESQGNWADGQIRCRVRKGRHASLSAKYIHVIRADETHSNGGVGRLIS